MATEKRALGVGDTVWILECARGWNIGLNILLYAGTVSKVSPTGIATVRLVTRYPDPDDLAGQSMRFKGGRVFGGGNSSARLVTDGEAEEAKRKILRLRRLRTAKATALKIEAAILNALNEGGRQLTADEAAAVLDKCDTITRLVELLKADSIPAPTP